MTRFFYFAVVSAGSVLAAIGKSDNASAANTEAWVDVSHSLGFPLGGLGTGYAAFGQYGFVRVNFDGRPRRRPEPRRMGIHRRGRAPQRQPAGTGRRATRRRHPFRLAARAQSARAVAKKHDEAAPLLRDRDAGEWNRSINSKMEVLGLPEEICKDTPRFAPYPRYKSSWEHLVRLLGLRLDERTLYLQPFQTVDFQFTGIELAGMKLDVTVQSGWKRVVLDGRPAPLPVKIPRRQKSARIEFLVDYRECSPALATRVRLVILGAPKGITPGVAEFTVFGVTERQPPTNAPARPVSVP
jgi:hypothetical protein